MRPSRIAFSSALASAALLAGPSAASAQLDHPPVRVWQFSDVQRGVGPVVAARGAQNSGRLARRHDFGPAAIDFVEPADGVATGEIASSATGKRFEVVAESPSHGNELPNMGGHSQLDYFQGFEKRADDATLRITLSEALVKTIDENGPVLGPEECAAGRDCSPIHGITRFTVRAYTDADFFNASGIAFISGYAGHWTIEAATFGPTPLWSNEDFERDFDADADGSGRHAEAFLTEPATADIDLSAVATGERFTLKITADTQAVDDRGRESGAEALLRNPEPLRPLVEATGLRPRGEPSLEEPVVEPPLPAVCPFGPDPDAGTLQFSRPDYITDETVGTPLVLVTRTGGSTGAVSASVITSDDSAEAGEDYTAVSTTVRFEDGDTVPRLVEIPILQDGEVENDETFDVSLLDPNCVLFGAPTTAEVTIAGVAEPPTTDEFTIGGTVTGLEGSGLVLATSGANDLTIDAKGPFEFAPPAPDGRAYDVTVATAPDNPDQECTVANGTGIVAGADVTDIVVECTTPAPVSGLDPSFDGDGRMSTSVVGGHVEAVAIQPDGMIVSAGGGGDFTLTRVTPEGALDPTFDGDGTVTTDLGGVDVAMDLAIQPDGKIVAAGRSSSDFAVARYLPTGAPDPDFGTDGIVKTDFNGSFDAASGVAIDADDRIVVAGNAQPSVFQNDFAVARYTPEGEPDATFGGGTGRVTTDLGSDTDLGNDVAIDAAGRIIVGGQVEQGADFALVRYETDGAVDTSFAGGSTVTNLPGSQFIKAVAVRPDGRIVVAGSAFIIGTEHDFALAEYDQDGNLDTSLGAGGLITTNVSGDRAFADDFAEDLALQNDGKVLVVGRNTSDTFNDLAIVRYTTDGEVDETFGGGGDGILVSDFHGSGDVGKDVAIQSDGKIVAAVDAANGGGFALARALP